MDASAGIGGARPARDEADARAAGHLADDLGHHGGGALVPADGEFNIAVVKGIERGQIAFARHAEYMLHAVNRQLVDQNLAAGAGAVIAAHRCTRARPWDGSASHRRRECVGAIRQFFCSMIAGLGVFGEEDFPVWSCAIFAAALVRDRRRPRPRRA